MLKYPGTGAGILSHRSRLKNIPVSWTGWWIDVQRVDKKESLMTGKNLFESILIGLLLLPGLVTGAVSEQAVMLDEIIIKDGSVVYGTVTSARDGVIKIDTEFAGVLSIKSDAIKSMQTQGSLTLQVADGTIIKDRPIQIEAELFTFVGSQGDKIVYNIEEILLVNPEPWELGDGYEWSGLSSFAMELKSGNSESQELDYKVHTTWRSLEDRFTLKLDGEIDEAKRITIVDNMIVVGKYDRFLADDNYWGVNLSLETDEFADLDLRSYVGPYYGRQLFDKPIIKLSAEAGLSYVNEKFMTVEDQDYPGANWNVKASSNYLGGRSRLYLDHTGIWNLDTTEDLILKTTLGLSFPLLDDLEASAEILLEYDSGAVEGIDEMDQTYKFRIGYVW
jgi:hypothetical protein